MLEFGDEFATLDAGQAGSELLKKIQERLQKSRQKRHARHELGQSREARRYQISRTRSTKAATRAGLLN